MHLRVILPVTSEQLEAPVLEEARRWASPGTTVDLTRIAFGPPSIESEFESVAAGAAILDQVARAASDAVDGIFISCFHEPAVHAAREIIDAPVVAGLEPAIHTALALGDRIGVLSIVPEVVPGVRRNIRQRSLDDRVSAIRIVNTPVLAIADSEKLDDRLFEEAIDLVRGDVADVLVLGCTGMVGGQAKRLQERLSADGPYVPVLDPTGAAICALESAVRLGVRPSRTAYRTPPSWDPASMGLPFALKAEGALS